MAVAEATATASAASLATAAAALAADFKSSPRGATAGDPADGETEAEVDDGADAVVEADVESVEVEETMPAHAEIGRPPAVDEPSSDAAGLAGAALSSGGDALSINGPGGTAQKLWP